MALLTAQDSNVPAGATIVYSAANASDTWKHTGQQPAKLRVRTAGTATTITITTYKTVQGLVVPNRVVAVSATQDKDIPLDKDMYANPADGLVTIATSPVTSVTTAIVVG